MLPAALLLLPLVLGPVATPAAAQGPGSPTITITGLPTFGSGGVLTGQTSGVDPGTHAVACYVLLEGYGFTIKPSFAAPLTPIQANGSFFLNPVTGGSDAYSSQYFVALVPDTFQPTPVGGAATLPMSAAYLATDRIERFGKTLQFAGREWGVKEVPAAVGPGFNHFSADPNDVFVDVQGRLHLTVSFHDGFWQSTEVVLLEPLGHGTYSFMTVSEVEDLPLEVTLGAFLWDSLGAGAPSTFNVNNEVDLVEHSAPGAAPSPMDSQFVVQRYNLTPENLFPFTVPDLSGAPLLSHFMAWRPDQLEFRVGRGSSTPFDVAPANLLAEYVFDHDPSALHYVPTPGTETMRFNLWISGPDPAPGTLAKVIVSDFRFTPETELYPLGCGVNPASSLVVLGGAPALGQTLTLGVDDPSGATAPGAIALVAVSGQAAGVTPCGLWLPGLGFGGGTGELLVALSPVPVIQLGASSWVGAGTPAPVALPIPANPALLGKTLFAQGALIDVSQVNPLVGLADGFALRIQL